MYEKILMRGWVFSTIMPWMPERNKFMVKIRLVTDKEFIGDVKLDCRVDDAKRYFSYHILNDLNKEPVPPCRDEASRQFLKDSYDISFAAEEDWYSVMCNVMGKRKRLDLGNLGEGIQWALGVIALSRKNIYSWFLDCVGENVWKALSKVPFDVLVCMRTSRMGLHGDHLWDIEYKIVDYPFQGKTIEVTVLDYIRNDDDFFEKLYNDEEMGTDQGLCRGRDGKYYTSCTDVDLAFNFWWKGEIEALLKQVDWQKRLKRDVKRLVDINQVHTVFSLGELLDGNKFSLLPDKGGLRRLSYCSEEEKAKIMESPEYIFFRDVFRINLHLKESTDIMSRKLPLLMVDKKADGTYHIHGDITFSKYPDLGCLIYEVLERRLEDVKERFTLIVDCEELMHSAMDIEKAACGFRLLHDSLDIYDADDSILLFGEALREAYYSGNCKIDKDFY